MEISFFFSPRSPHFFFAPPFCATFTEIGLKCKLLLRPENFARHVGKRQKPEADCVRILVAGTFVVSIN